MRNIGESSPSQRPWWFGRMLASGTFRSPYETRGERRPDGPPAGALVARPRLAPFADEFETLGLVLVGEQARADDDRLDAAAERPRQAGRGGLALDVRAQREEPRLVGDDLLA